MTNVILRTGAAATNGVVELIVDGTDLTRTVLATPFSIESSADGQWSVRLALGVDELEVQLADATVVEVPA